MNPISAGAPSLAKLRLFMIKILASSSSTESPPLEASHSDSSSSSREPACSSVSSGKRTDGLGSTLVSLSGFPGTSAGVWVCDVGSLVPVF